MTKQDFEDIRKEALAQVKRREKKNFAKCRVSGFESFLIFYLPRPESPDPFHASFRVSGQGPPWLPATRGSGADNSLR